MSRRPNGLDERDHVLIVETIGYLRALYALWDDGDSNTGRVLTSPAGYVLALGSRLRELERKVWPVDD